MIIVPVKEGESIDRAFKKTEEKIWENRRGKGIARTPEIHETIHKKTEGVNKAIYVQQLQQSEEGM